MPAYDGYSEKIVVSDKFVPRFLMERAFITGSDFLMDGGVTSSYFFGELPL